VPECARESDPEGGREEAASILRWLREEAKLSAPVRGCGTWKVLVTLDACNSLSTSHIETVSWFDLPTFAAIAKYAAALPRCSERDWFSAIKLRIVPIEFRER
jgi:hypothetical protein